MLLRRHKERNSEVKDDSKQESKDSKDTKNTKNAGGKKK